MGSVREEIDLLRRLAPADHGLTVFDAETQETSYGALLVDDLPFIFDTHRKEEWFVSTVEVLTEILAPVRTTPEEIARFAKVAEHAVAIPYSACFFKGSLHVYGYYGPARGFDLSVVGASVSEAERRIVERTRALWDEIPRDIVAAQQELLMGKRKARYPADFEVLMTRKRALESGGSES